MIINFFSIHNLLFVCKLVLVTLDQVIGVNCKQDHIVPYFTLNVTNMFAHISICFLLTITNTAICGSNTANMSCARCQSHSTNNTNKHLLFTSHDW